MNLDIIYFADCIFQDKKFCQLIRFINCSLTDLKFEVQSVATFVISNKTCYDISL